MLIKHSFLILVISSLFACSNGDGDVNEAGGGRGGDAFGFLSLNVTDAAYDDAAEIWIKYDSVVLKPADETLDPITVPVDPPLHVDMLTLQGINSEPLFSDATLPTGMYEWVRLVISADDDNIMDSYIKLKDGSEHELSIPSGSESGLQIIGGLEIIANTPVEKTIDFDLRRSIVVTGTGDYKLIPVMKLIDNDQSGTIVGTVSLATLTDAGCSDADPATDNAVYLYEGFNVTPDDIDGNDPDPVASSLVTLDIVTGEYEYSFGFVPLGMYTATFTCQTDLDAPDSNDVIDFSTTRNVNVVGTDPVVLSGNSFRF